MLDELSARWLEAKEQERLAVERRREIEDLLVSALRIEETLDGTATKETPDYQIKIVGRLNRKVDSDKVQEIAAEYGLSDHLSSLFRWKPEMNMTAWKRADVSITKPFLAAITTTPGRPSFTITKKD